VIRLCYVPEEIELTECELLVIVAIGNAPTMSDPARLKEPNLSTRLIEHYFVAMNESGRLALTPKGWSVYKLGGISQPHAEIAHGP